MGDDEKVKSEYQKPCTTRITLHIKNEAKNCSPVIITIPGVNFCCSEIAGSDIPIDNSLS